MMLLTSDETPLPSGKITIEEASWVVSLPAIGSLFGCMFYGFVTKFSRKWTLVVAALPLIVSQGFGLRFLKFTFSNFNNHFSLAGF